MLKARKSLNFPDPLFFEAPFKLPTHRHTDTLTDNKGRLKLATCKPNTGSTISGVTAG